MDSEDSTVASLHNASYATLLQVVENKEYKKSGFWVNADNQHDTPLNKGQQPDTNDPIKVD